MGQARDPADMDFPMPREVPMLQVCHYFKWTVADYMALDNVTAQWAHALVNAEGDAVER